jgi:hypothetical protein
MPSVNHQRNVTPSITTVPLRIMVLVNTGLEYLQNATKSVRVFTANRAVRREP